MKGFIGLFFNKKKKMSRKLLFRGPRGIVAGTGAGTGRQILFPGEWGAKNRPGTSGNGFPVAPLCRRQRKDVFSLMISNTALDNPAPSPPLDSMNAYNLLLLLCMTTNHKR
jgi:hypothetical protein